MYTFLNFLGRSRKPNILIIISFRIESKEVPNDPHRDTFCEMKN